MVHDHHLSQPASTSGASTPPMIHYTGAPEAMFSESHPMLVVVNPTLNFTPHLTPPSTLVMYDAARRGQWLMPPGLNLNWGTHHTVGLDKEDAHNSLLRDQVIMEQFLAVVSRLPPSIFPPPMHSASRADEARPQPQAPLRASQRMLGVTMTMNQSLSRGMSHYRLQLEQQHDGLHHADVTDVNVGRDIVASVGPGFVPDFNAPGDLHDMVPLVNPYAPGNNHDTLTAAMELQQFPPMTLVGVGAPNRLSMSSAGSTSSHMTSLSGYSAASTSATSASGAEGAERDTGMLQAKIGVGAEVTACLDGTATLVTAAVPANHVVPDEDENVVGDLNWREVVWAGEAEVDGGVHVHGLDQGENAHACRGTDVNLDEALEEEEDEPRSPLPSASVFTSASHSRLPRSASNHRALLQFSPPQTEEEDSAAVAAHRRRKRHSTPPRSTFDSVQMRLALSLSPTLILDPQLSVSLTAGEAGCPEVVGMTVLPRTQSASSSRSRSAGGKRWSFSAANKRKGSTPSVPATGPNTSAGPHPDAGNNAPNGALTRHSTVANNARGKQSMRIAAAKASKEAEEQRLRELFVKLPVSSYQDLAKLTTNSVGNLTRLLNPDPDIFPINHPYRSKYISGEIQLSCISAPSPMHASRPAAVAPPPPPLPAAAIAAANPPAQTCSGSAQPVFLPPLRRLATSRSAVALPLATQIQVGSSNGPATRMDHTYGMVSYVYVNSASTGSGGYRLKGPPKDQVMESDSEEEDEGVIMPSSVALEKLKALAERRGIPLIRCTSEGNAPAAQPQLPLPASGDNIMPQCTELSTPRPLPTPIPIKYPYNLPLPIAPTTPKTTRRNMLANEMSDSLRRNLLWQRHLSKPNLAALKQTASAGRSRNNGFVLLPTVSAFPPMIQLHAKGTKPEGTSLLTVNCLANKEESEAHRQHREVSLRNKSWANADFHATGW